MRPRNDPYLRDVLLDAADLSPDERPAFLEAACGTDAEFRVELQSLLERLDDADVHDEPHAMSPVAVIGPPERIGRYRIVQAIGEGGMGTVYRAEQEHPVRRTVALKLIKLGMDTRQVVGRFNAERQALAMMDHPHIARVFDAGATGTGRPYFVMELVEGVPVTDYCDASRLTIRERLELFVQVCQAVQHAHTKGVIHRDLKPSNVLVAQQDGQPVPKVIDFGIAKATQGRLTDQTLTTALPQWMGTPQYMSPEQADGQGNVDTRTDVYSLGVLLYELLARATPFDFRTAAYDQVLRTIREVEPAAPSARVAMSGGGSGAAARELKGDLDRIVLKAMEKDRGRRYETALDLASDVQRYLRHETVKARNPTTAYRFAKLVRRNRLAFASVAALVLALLAGLAASTWSLRRALRAEGEQRNLRLDAEAKAYASDMAAVQQAISVNCFAKARDLLDRHRPKHGERDLRGWEWRYLWQQCRRDTLYKLGPAPMFPHSIAVSRDGRWAAVGEQDGGWLSIYDLPERKLIGRTRVGDSSVRVAFSPADAVLACAAISTSSDGGQQSRLCLRDLHDGRIITSATLNDVCQGLAYSADGETLVTSTATERGKLTLWRVRDLTPVSQSDVPQAYDTVGVHFAATHDLSDIAIAGDPTLSVIDLKTGTVRWKEKFSPNWPMAVAFSPDKRVLAVSVGEPEGKILLYDAATGRQLGPPLEGHSTWIGELVFWPDGKTLASASGDRTIRLWDVRDPAHGKSIGRPLHGHEHGRLALHPDGRTLLSGADDGFVYLWDSAAVRQEPGDHATFPIQTWVFDGPGASLFCIQADGKVLRRDGNNPVTASVQMDIGAPITWSSPQRQGEGRLVVAQRGDALVAVDLRTRTILRSRPLIDDMDRCQITPEGHLVAHVKDRATVLEWDMRSGKDLPPWQALKSVSWIAFSRDGRWRVAVGPRGSGVLIDTLSGRRAEFDLDTREVEICCFSPDGTTLAATSLGRIGLWRTDSLAAGGKVPAFASFAFTLAPHSVAFSHDGKRLAAGDEGREAIKVFDVETRQEVLTLSARGSGFNRIAFSPDGTVLASSNDQNELHLWRSPTLAEIDAAEAEGAAASLPN